MKIAVEVIGWFGAALILGAYALLSAGRVRVESLTYQWMNIVGAAGFIVNSGWDRIDDNGKFTAGEPAQVWKLELNKL